MLVKDIMSKNVISLKSSDHLTKFISILENDRIHEVPVIDDNKLVGLVTYRDITTRGISDPSKQKIKSIMVNAPSVVSPNTEIDDVARSLFSSGLRALPVVSGRDVVGIVSISDIVKFASKSPDFKCTSVDSIMSSPEVIFGDDSIGRARVIMREKNISRLPVVSIDGKLAGIVDSYDLIQAVRSPHEKMGWYSMASEMDRIMGIGVSTIMDTTPKTVDSGSNLSDVSRIMIKNNMNGAVIVKTQKPVGIIALKDLLEFYVSGTPQEGLYYQVVGLSKEDPFVTETVDKSITSTLKKISKVLKPTYFFLHVKKFDTGGLKHRYSVRARLRTDKGVFISKSEGWDARDAVGLVLDRLERSVLSTKKELRDRENAERRRQKGAR